MSAALIMPPSQCCSPRDSYFDEPRTPRGHRRQQSTGAGRSWSEEEERFLIESRQHKMPYKHIAARLHKTELACRLHHHQLSYGTKRSRRAVSISSNMSLCSITDPLPSPATLQRRLPVMSPPATPTHKGSRSQSPRDPVPILPKPSTTPYPLRAEGSHHRIDNIDDPHNLIITNGSDHHPYHHHRRSVDEDRLGRLYEAHRTDFWASIARDYGQDVSPVMLENTWRRSYTSSPMLSLPTPPDESPSPSSLSSFVLPRACSTDSTAHAGPDGPDIRPNIDPCAIASLLTEDRDVWCSRRA